LWTEKLLRGVLLEGEKRKSGGLSVFYFYFPSLFAQKC